MKRLDDAAIANDEELEDVAAQVDTLALEQRHRGRVGEESRATAFRWIELYDRSWHHQATGTGWRFTDERGRGGSAMPPRVE